MLFSHRSKNRAADAGPWPTETLKRIRQAPTPPSIPRHEYTPTPSAAPLAVAARRYSAVFSSLNDGPVASSKAPLPDNLAERLKDIRGASFFMDADLVGVSAVHSTDWYQPIEDQDTAIVIAVAHCRIPEPENLAHQWVAPAVSDIAQMRAGEIVSCLAGHLRHMGFAARAHFGAHSLVHLEALALRSGVAMVRDNALYHPYLGTRFSLAVVTTNYRLPHDQPLDPRAETDSKRMRRWWGINGAVSGRELNRRQRRASHLSRYPMEQVRRVDLPTTMIIDDEVPQVPKRAAFFERALYGDLGEKAKRERSRFAFKTPLSLSQLDAIRKLVPYQNGAVTAQSGEATARFSDPGANARAIKSLSYALGADITGICEIPRYAWFSHHNDGSEIQPYHRYAVVMVVDQGFDTMEGASGDDWISGAQSMRSYLRGAEIAGVMAQLLRDSVTVDMPLECDRPIDFGLQYFCENCYKCARECPCDAIPFGNKVMFNGYEMWKPDVERCDADGGLFPRLASWLGINAILLKRVLVPVATRLDDWLGNGRRNLKKKWWFDHEIVDGVTVTPKATNERDIDPTRRIDASKQKIAYYSANVMPPADSLEVVLVNRKAALASAAQIETPAQARERLRLGGVTPTHYVAPPVRHERKSTMPSQMATGPYRTSIDPDGHDTQAEQSLP